MNDNNDNMRWPDEQILVRMNYKDYKDIKRYMDKIYARNERERLRIREKREQQKVSNQNSKKKLNPYIERNKINISEINKNDNDIKILLIKYGYIKVNQSQ